MVGTRVRFFPSTAARRYLRFVRSFILADESDVGTQHEDKRRATIGAAVGETIRAENAGGYAGSPWWRTAAFQGTLGRLGPAGQWAALYAPPALAKN